MEYISVEQAKEKIQANELILVDIRENYEHEICSVDSLNIPMGEITERIDELPKDKKLAIMCRTGKRAEAVANVLIQEHSLNNICVLEGGIIGWIETLELDLEKY